MSQPLAYARGTICARIRRRLRECSAQKLIAWMRKPGSTQKAQSRTQKAQSIWKVEAGDPKEYLCLLCSALRFLCSSSAQSSAYPGADARGTVPVSQCGNGGLTAAPMALQIRVYNSKSKNAGKLGSASRTNVSPDRLVSGN